jgi:hypothetical protein
MNAASALPSVLSDTTNVPQKGECNGINIMKITLSRDKTTTGASSRKQC